MSRGRMRKKSSKAVTRAERSHDTREALIRDRDDLVAAVVERVLGTFQEMLFPKEGDADLRETIAQFVGAILTGVPHAVGTSHWKFHHTLAACAGSSRIRG